LISGDLGRKTIGLVQGPIYLWLVYLGVGLKGMQQNYLDWLKKSNPKNENCKKL